MITKISLVLVIISAMIHPLWNMLLKKSEEKVIFYFNIHLMFTLMFIFVPFVYPVREITLSGWIFVLLSSLTHFFYQIFLCKTYELGDMSLSYPIMRSSPIFVLFMGLLFLHEVPSAVALIGIAVVIIGVQVINQKRLSLKGFLRPFRHVDKKVMTAAVLTAFYSACYSVIDKKGVLLMNPVLFFYLFFAISGFLFLGYLVFMKKESRRYFEMLKKDKFHVMIAAILEFSSYIFILYAFRISKVAYIVALRQISVVFGTLYGILFLKERYGAPRFVGSMIIFFGIFLIMVFG